MEDGSSKSAKSPRISPNHDMTKNARLTSAPFDCASPPTESGGWSSSPNRPGHKGSKRWKGENLQDTSLHPPYDCTSQSKINGGSPGADRVDSLVQKMQLLRSKPEVD